MKSLLVLVLAIAATGLVACQSSGMSASTSTIDLVGTQSRTTVEVPSGGNVATSNAPYALQGIPAQEPAMPTGMGYQAR
jgi:hypothetical protein